MSDPLLKEGHKTATNSDQHQEARLGAQVKSSEPKIGKTLRRSPTENDLRMGEESGEHSSPLHDSEYINTNPSSSPSSKVSFVIPH